MKPTLKIQDIAPNLDFIIGTASTENVNYIYNQLQNGSLEIDFDVFLPTIGKNLQRDFVWTDLQKSEYILTILRTYSTNNAVSGMQPISIVRNEWFSNMGKQVWQVIDGKQRISTILDFLACKVYFEWEGIKYFYNDLDTQIRGIIGRFWFNMTYAVNYKENPVTDLQKIEWFRSVNFLGTPQDKEHLNNLLK